MAPLLIAALVVVVSAIGVFAYVRGARVQSEQGGAQPIQTAGPSTAAPASLSAAAQPPADEAPPAHARFGPHKQATLPALPFGGYPPARPADVVRTVYKFAAEHPEVLGYVPCYCGCEKSGHRGNDDCFVAARAANGDVTAWEPHGMT